MHWSCLPEQKTDTLANLSKIEKQLEAISPNSQDMEKLLSILKEQNRILCSLFHFI